MTLIILRFEIIDASTELNYSFSFEGIIFVFRNGLHAKIKISTSGGGFPRV